MGTADRYQFGLIPTMRTLRWTNRHVEAKRRRMSSAYWHDLRPCKHTNPAAMINQWSRIPQRMKSKACAKLTGKRSHHLRQVR